MLPAYFNAAAGTVRKNKNFVFGSTDGAIELPMNVKFPDYKFSRLVFSDFHLSYQPVYPGVKDSPLQKSIDETDVLELAYDENTFSFEVSTINYDSPGNALYSWKLEGFYEKWTQPGANNLIRFTNLPPGRYILHVRAISREEHDIVFQERAMKIIIPQPFWSSWWEILSYILLVIGGFYFVLRVINLRKIKNITSVLKNSVSPDKISICKGKLIGGEIYISDIRAWWKKMNLRFRYEDSATLYPICYTSIPIKNDNNDFFYRDKEGEDIFITSIDSNLDRLYSTLSLDKPDVKVLTELISKGWKLYLHSSKGTYSTASYPRDKNGIEWFSSANEESPDSLNIKDILHAYLNSRNYIESDGNFNLFDSDKIKNLTPEKFIGSLIPNNINIENFYKPIIS